MNIIDAVHDALRKDADDEADQWLRSQSRKERRRLFRKHGISKGFSPREETLVSDEPTYRVARKVWGDSIAAAEYHADRARELLHDAGEAEQDEHAGTFHVVDRILQAARIHAELSTAAATRAQAAVL